MAFAFNPDDRPARIIRYVDAGSLPGTDILAIYDKNTNTLLIDRDYFERLSDIDRHMVIRTHLPVLEIFFHKDKTPFVKAA
mgnify:CR=1 FL=1